MLKFDFDGIPLDPQQAPSSGNSVSRWILLVDLCPRLKGCHANISNMVSVALPTLFRIGQQVVGCGITIKLGDERFQLHQLICSDGVLYVDKPFSMHIC